MLTLFTSRGDSVQMISHQQILPSPAISNRNSPGRQKKDNRQHSNGRESPHHIIIITRARNRLLATPGMEPVPLKVVKRKRTLS
jgi:hypothetical protein